MEIVTIPRHSITFTPNDDWLKAQVDSQEYSLKGDVVNALIRPARQQHENIKIIRENLIRAEQEGTSNRTPEQKPEDAKKQPIKDD